jgi:lipopolysaccharide biosynthesis glycosyltransferase
MLALLIPELMNFAGFAIFVDAADMLCRGDLTELWSMRDKNFAVQVVKHDYRTKHPRKYVGTELEADNQDYPRKNWSAW